MKKKKRKKKLQMNTFTMNFWKKSKN